MSSRRSRLVLSVLMLMSAIFVAVGSLSNALTPVLAAPSITLSPKFSPRGVLITFSGSGFLSTDTSCVITLQDRTGTNVSIPFTKTCSKSSGSTTLSGSFVVPFVSPIRNPYTVVVEGILSGLKVEAALATFTITAIAIDLSIGARGQTVKVNGSLGGSDTTCSLSGSVVGTKSCVISGSTGGNFTAFFVVANVAPGPYTIRATGSPSGVFVETTFTVQGPSITLRIAPGPYTSTLPASIGDSVGVNGTDFSFADTTCSISSPTSSSAVANPACSIIAGTGRPLGNFTVGPVAQGSYVIRVTGSTGDFAEATLTVGLASASLVLNPTNATIGATVTFRATGFQTGDTGCVVQSANDQGTPGSNNLLITSPTCTMSSRVATGTFVVGPLATTNIKWNVTVKGTPGNDFPYGASAFFNVTAQITVSPTAGTNGTVVSVTGTGFSSTATSCTVGISPTAGFTGRLCGVIGSTGQVAASFTVGTSAVPGVYVVNVTDSEGFFAGTIFQVGTPSAQITLSPNSVTPGFFVGISGSGFNPYDLSCTITPISSLFTTSSCTASSGTVAASITVLPTAPPGLYVITVKGSSGDFASNLLAVVTITTQTSTTTTTSSTTTSTSTATTLTTTGTSISLTTTTFQTTGISTETSRTFTTTTALVGITTTATTTLTTSWAISTSTVLTTVTTVITHTLGQIISSMQTQPELDGYGIVSVLIIFGSWAFRRFTK